MAEYPTSQDRFLKGFVVGSVIGLIAGILFAPKSGRELMSEIKEKGSRILTHAEDVFEEATAAIEDIQYHAEELMKDWVKMREKAKEIFVR